jgi:predicted esterase
MNAGQLTMPIACTTGGRDKLVPPDSVARLVTQLQKQNRPAHLIHRPEGGHDTNYADATEAFEWVLARSARQKP